MTLSVIIPTCNRDNLLSKCLSLLSPKLQTLDFSFFEVIVSDDGTGESTKKMLSKEFPWVVYKEGPRKGPAANRNNGAKYSSGEWLVFLDDDVLPDKNLLNNYKQGIEQNINALAFEGAIVPDDWNLMKKDLSECPINISGGCFWSANICINRNLFNVIGGFDENFLIAAQEDQDLFERLKTKTQVKFIKESRVIHPVRFVLLANKLSKIPISIANWYVFERKRSGFWSTLYKGFVSQLRFCFSNIKALKWKSCVYNLATLTAYLPVLIYSELIHIMSSRKFKWLSSVMAENKIELERLEKSMSKFYSEMETRVAYNKMISKHDEPIDDISKAFLDWFSNYRFANILEVGCGTGRVRKLLSLPQNSHYIGIEISPETVEENKKKWQSSDFYPLGVYDMEQLSNKPFDLIFSFYVLEHLVYPKKALDLMYNSLQTNGFLVIVCPDFCASRRFASQALGLSNIQSAKSKFRKFRVLDAIIGFYDSKVRLKIALREVKQHPGRFMVNVNPISISLKKEEVIWPDCDAVYLANKEEIEFWALQKNMEVIYPEGKSGIFAEHTFIVLRKN